MVTHFKQQYGEWALVTGAKSGIGAHIADQLAEKGLNILLVSRNEDELITHAELKLKGVDVTVLSPGLTATPMVADNGMDWKKTPMVAMDPAKVASLGIDGLGKRPLTIPGRRNGFMATMMKLTPLKLAAIMNEKMMRKAIDKSKI